MLVSGARAHANQGQVHAAIDALPLFTTLLTGLATGVDQWADARGRERGMRVLGIAAEWRRWGMRAGPIRNTEMVMAADRVIAFPWWGCRGTIDAIEQAKRAQVPCEVIAPKCSHLDIETIRITPSMRRPWALDITAKTAREAWQARRGRWRETDHAEKLFADLAKEAGKMVGEGNTLAAVQSRLRAEGAPSLGAVFAPTSALLFPAIAARKEAGRLAQQGRLVDAVKLENDTWNAYKFGTGAGTGFLAQMLASRRRYGAVWGLIAAQPAVALGCFCARLPWWPEDEPWPHHCHRYLVAEMFEEMGGKRVGEVGQEKPDQIALW